VNILHNKLTCDVQLLPKCVPEPKGVTHLCCFVCYALVSIWCIILSKYFGFFTERVFRTSSSAWSAFRHASEYLVRIFYRCVDPDRKVRNYIFPKNEIFW